MRGAAVVLLAAGLATGDTRAQIFRSGVDLVRFDVRVTGQSGRPITDLRPDEIQIVESGRALPILLFQHVVEPAEEYAAASLRTVSAEVSSNRSAPRGHLYLLVFDQQHITPGNEQIARHAAEAFIKARVRPFDRVAVFGIPGPGPDLGFTADRTRAAAELRKLRGVLTRNVTTAVGNFSIHEAYEAAAGSDTVISAILARQSVDVSADVGAAPANATGLKLDRAAVRAQEDPAVLRRVIQENARHVVAGADAEARDSLLRLADLIEQYRSIEGRKTVVFFSEGFHQRNVTRELERVEAAAAQSYAVFYAFDLNRRAATLDQTGPSPTSEAAEIQARTEPLGSLAAETDGLLLADASSRLGAALDRIAEEAQDYYLVGFSPSPEALAAVGRYRRVTVRVTRPGARVSARTGYAVPRNAPPARRLAIDSALAAPFAQQALNVDYTTYVLRSPDSERARVYLSLEADLPVRDATHEMADVVFLVRDVRDGRVAATGTGTMPLPAAPSLHLPTGTGTYRVHFDLSPGRYIMRAVVREPGGLVGSADRRLDIRSVSGPDIGVSDIVLASGTGALPVRAHAYAQDGLTGMIEAYGRAPEQLRELTVTAALLPSAGERPAITMRATLGDTMRTGSGVVRQASFALPLSGVPPGSYVTRVAVAAGAEPVADLTREADVVAGHAPVVRPESSNAESGAAALPASRRMDVLQSDAVRPARAALRSSAAPGAADATRGFELFAQGQFAEAAAALDRALRVDRAPAAVAFVLGWAYEGAGNTSKAIGAWRAAAAIDPTMVPAHLALADACLRIAEPALAIQAIRAGLAAVPDSPELQAKLSLLQGK